jgi:hypothetical protein
MAEKVLPIERRCGLCKYYRSNWIEDGPFEGWGRCDYDHNIIRGTELDTPYLVHPNACCGLFTRPKMRQSSLSPTRSE